MEEDTDTDIDIDPYEEQLLSVFRNCDKNNTGILDNDGFDQLCDALQLEQNHRNLLVASLCENAHYQITFAQFRDALLKLLASFKIDKDDDDDDDDIDQRNDLNANCRVEPSVTSSHLLTASANKKYGRRSRPSSSKENDAKSTCQTVTLQNEAPKADVHESTSLVATNESSISASSRDLQVQMLCDYLGVCKNSSIDDCNLVSICTALGLTHSVDEIIREIKSLKGETACAEGSPKGDIDIDIDVDVDTAQQVPRITYGQFFELIRTLELNKSSSMIDSITRSIESSTFGEDNSIWNVDMNCLCCIGYDTLVYLFESSGINDAGMFLNDLGVAFNADVNLSQLATQLQKELIDAQKCLDNTSKHLYSLRNPHFLLLQALVVVYQAQIKWYKSCMEQMQCERDKLRNDLAFANERASLLASEVDDNHARMEDSMQQKLKNLEHKYSDQIRELTHQWCSERDQLANQNFKMEKQLQQLLCDEISLRSDVATLKQDYENIERENKNLLDQLTDAENFREDLEKEIQRLSYLKQKVKELENSNEQAISFLEKMNQLQAENIKLRDKNDELVIELENITLREMQNRNSCAKRRGNSPLEGEEKSIGGGDVTLISTHRMFSKVRKCDAENDLLYSVDVGNGGTCSTSSTSSTTTNTSSTSMTERSNRGPVPPQSPCESGVEADISTPYSSLDAENTNAAAKPVAVTNDTTIIAQLKSRINFLETFIEKCKLKITCDSVDANDEDGAGGCGETKADDLEKQCENLQQKLDQVQNEILKILLEKRVCSEENCALKTKISQLMQRLPVACDIADVESGDGRPSQNIDNKQNILLDDSEALQMVEKERNVDNADSADNADNAETNKANENHVRRWRPSDDNDAAIEDENQDDNERNYVKLVEKCSRLSDENKTLAKKCNELESCLTMLRNEYDQCEEYWSMKLDEERKLFEQEQCISDEKFAQLQLKIEEYGEMFNCETAAAAQLDSKLPPIAENDNLEKEVNDLQEEFAAYKRKMERENKEKQIEIDRLLRIINNYEMPDSSPSTNNDETRSLESVHSDKTYTIPNEDASLNSRNISFVKTQQTKLAHLKMRKKRLKKQCSHLEREKNVLSGNLCRMKSESRMLFTFSPCTYALQQRHAEMSTNGLFNRLRLQEVKNRMRSIMSQQQNKLNKTMREMLHQQEKELSKYRSALASSQQISQSLQETSKKQAEQIAMTDVLVKELYCENSQLMTTIHQLEQQHLDCQTPVLL